jgi:hypothetical protein
VRHALPGQLTIGPARVEIATNGTTEPAPYGREAERYEAKWTGRRAMGRGHIEIRPTSKLTSEIVVTLEAPAGLVGKLLWSTNGLRRLATLYARALRYEIETRAVEEADGFDIRRTSTELVRARTA